MIRRSRVWRSMTDPEKGRFSQSTFHDGAHRQAPGDSTPWKDTSTPLLRLRAWWMAPASKGSIVAAWTSTFVVASYCYTLQVDAKGTYLMNNTLLGNLHHEVIRADANEERVQGLQNVIKEKEAQKADMRQSHSKSIAQCNDSKEELRTGLNSYETELARERARGELTRERNAQLVQEMNALRIELYQLRKQKASLEESVSRMERTVGAA